MAKASKVRDFAVTPEFIQKLTLREQVREQAKALTAQEFALRQEIVVEMSDPTKLEGSEKIALANGYELKATKKQTYTLSNEANAAVEFCQALHVAGFTDLAAGFIKWTPEMSKSTYNEVMKVIDIVPNGKEMLARCLSIKPAAAELEIVAPKVEKQA